MIAVDALTAARTLGLRPEADPRRDGLWRANCPLCVIHSEHALQIRESVRGAHITVHCKTGCKPVEIVARLEAAMASPGEVLQHSLVIRASAVTSRSIRWAWTGRLALGYLTVITGIEGLGKSVFAAWLIARLTRGDLPGEWRDEPIDVLIVAGEDGIADTWRPRLELAGAELERVPFLNLDKLPDGWNVRDGIEQIRTSIEETGAKFIHIDALLDHMPPPRAGESINSPTFVRQAVGPLKRLVRELEIVGQFQLHPPKARSADFRDLVQASQAFSAIPRIGLLFAYHPDDQADDPERRRVLLRGKGNLGRDPGALEFRVVGKPYTHGDGRTSDREVVVDLAPSTITLADLAPERLVGTSREPTKTEQAADVLRDALQDGEWHEAGPIRARLAAVGLDSGSVRTGAMSRASVETRKTGDGPWEWRTQGSIPAGRPTDASPARARSLTDRGLFDSEGQEANNNGKGPRVHGPQHSTAHEPKGPYPAGTSRARTREANGQPDGLGIEDAEAIAAEHEEAG